MGILRDLEDDSDYLEDEGEEHPDDVMERQVIIDASYITAIFPGEE